jgi:hypothetical protein
LHARGPARPPRGEAQLSHGRRQRCATWCACRLLRPSGAP